VSFFDCSDHATALRPDHESFASQGFNFAEQENDAALKTIRRRAWTTLLNKIREHTADATLLEKVRASFKKLFRYDEHAVPRVWKPEDGLGGIFKKAKEVSTDIPPSRPSS
jgi:hypothetical protein